MKRVFNTTTTKRSIIVIYLVIQFWNLEQQLWSRWYLNECCVKSANKPISHFFVFRECSSSSNNNNNNNYLILFFKSLRSSSLQCNVVNVRQDFARIVVAITIIVYSRDCGGKLRAFKCHKVLVGLTVATMGKLWASTLGVGVSMNFQRVILGVKIHWIENFLIPLERS